MILEPTPFPQHLLAPSLLPPSSPHSLPPLTPSDCQAFYAASSQLLGAESRRNNYTASWVDDSRCNRPCNISYQGESCGECPRSVLVWLPHLYPPLYKPPLHLAELC